LKVLEKSLNLNLQYVEILHLITVLKQTLVCISPVLVVSSLDYLTNSHCSLTPACIIHYSIGEFSTVHVSVTLQSKFWSTASRMWLFVDNFGAWKLQI